MKFLILLTVFLAILFNQGEGQRSGPIYQCLGGCYNKCILTSGRGGNIAETLPCSLICSTGCFFQQQPGNNYYCQLGCSVFQCSRFQNARDGAGLEKCLRDCNNSFCRNIA